MNTRDISQAKDPDLRAATKALWRASELARKIAIQAETELVVVRGEQIVLIDASTIREQAEAESGRNCKINKIKPSPHHFSNAFVK